ncbi:cysteinyl-tRNA(Pro) deacylase [Megasphaera cerevisiae DSM 20462]|jgi:Cys-tRNA(Pro)/Cys-tRNA(Cys) deacylase|uniref:Cys-tRNA(Pro)/Cys-tRNA(Cys) deacylase n=1 Tax=Megasphaera cerevisiae DSM 20462 TaxID=1122219 RepID=A0A0J6WVE6_9FIRM|nr:Cys-tRNA(Pro) deacylase [Megasphaera cerevisiae]KMO86183.1 cysteinyl-tRNA(Pro) deacylase [Megasphaera cerevisiae DSM 20462]OKY52892.1 aminoacyl-tRNA deacylase [Megasphaera cerevisiae]SKA16280.1 Cys-tRNA(Pro)/Cys-tRNA(Cys) deacylase [Megasphaera cerevisiae DSM 20462]
MAKTKKTNVMRILDKEKIAYSTKAYSYSEEDLSGVHAAAELGMNPEQVFKTLVGQGNKTGPVVFCIPSNKELDLKKAAACSGNKSVHLLHVKDLLGLTGYIRGGCSPIGMKKQFPTYIDKSATSHEAISLSAGMRGQQVLIDPREAANLIHAVFYDLTMTDVILTEGRIR